MVQIFSLYGVTHKNETAYFQQYVDAITGISVLGNFNLNFTFSA